MSLLNFLKELQRKELDELHRSDTVTSLVLTWLPPIATQILLRCAMLPQASSANHVELSYETLKQWATKSTWKTEWRDALDALRQIGVVEKGADGTGVLVSSAVLSNLRLHLLGVSDTTSTSASTSSQPLHRIKEERFNVMEEKARLQWRAVQHLLVGAVDNSGVTPPESVVECVLSIELLSIDADDAFRISHSGFQFLLLDLHTQLWRLLLAHIERIGDERRVSMLRTLCHLATQAPGTVLQQSVEHDDDFVELLVGIGLLYDARKSDVEASVVRPAFVCTPLVCALVPHGKLPRTSALASREQFIVVESNYRVYAYTNSQLQVAVLSLFCTMQVRLPNLIVALITRESIREAFVNGITAEQILTYLAQHAHPQALEGRPAVPEALAEQVRLWERERDRVTYAAGLLYQYDSSKVFNDILSLMDAHNLLIWHSQQELTMVVKSDAQEVIKKYLKNIK